MKMDGNTDQATTLDVETLQLLGSDPAVLAVVDQNRTLLRESVLARVDQDDDDAVSFLTILGNEGTWVELEPGAEKKILKMDEKTGLESYLIRMQPGVLLDEHHHEEDELCIVLEGDVAFDDIHLVAGDFHFARKGTSHGRASTVHGALIFLQSQMAPSHA